MPTYRYRCEGCGEEFELWQSITADPLRTHDHGCGGKLVKVMTPAGIVLKGSGFYKTDNRSGSKRRDGGADKSSDKGAEKSDSKSDSKSDTSSSSKDATKPDSKTASSSSSDGKSSTGAATS